MACGGDTRRAMTLYRYNLKLSQEMFTLISCFEVALRNRIDNQMVARPNAVTDASYVLNQYARIMKLFNWMGIDGPSLVYGLDHVAYVSGKMMCI